MSSRPPKFATPEIAIIPLTQGKEAAETYDKASSHAFGEFAFQNWYEANV